MCSLQCCNPKQYNNGIGGATRLSVSIDYLIILPENDDVLIKKISNRAKRAGFIFLQKNPVVLTT